MLKIALLKYAIEASGGLEVSGQHVPTNGLLVHEEDPDFIQGNVNTAQAEVED